MRSKAGARRQLPYTLEFYDDPGTGRQPVLEWLQGLDDHRKKAIGVALRVVLQARGLDVCRGEWGKQLGDGLFEFRVRHDASEILQMFTDQTPRPEVPTGPVLLRVFGHAHGNRLLLLLAGYDKAEDPSDRRQQREIALARARLREFRSRRSP